MQKVNIYLFGTKIEHKISTVAVSDHDIIVTSSYTALRLNGAISFALSSPLFPLK